MQRVEKAAAPVYGWDCPFPPANFPGFDFESFVEAVSNHAGFNGFPFCKTQLGTTNGGLEPGLVVEGWLRRGTQGESISRPPIQTTNQGIPKQWWFYQRKLCFKTQRTPGIMVSHGIITFTETSRKCYPSKQIVFLRFCCCLKTP